MMESDVKKCITELKNKKCEGFDIIPVCVLIDSCDIIVPAMSSLFSSIYLTQKIPEQWKVAKIIPIFKKGSKT